MKKNTLAQQTGGNFSFCWLVCRCNGNSKRNTYNIFALRVTNKLLTEWK